MSNEKNYSIDIKGKKIGFKSVDDLSRQLENCIVSENIEDRIIQKYEKPIIIGTVSEFVKQGAEIMEFEYSSFKVMPKGSEPANAKTYSVMNEVNRVLDIYSIKGREMSEKMKEKNKFYIMKFCEIINAFQDKYGMEISNNMGNLEQNELETILSNILIDNKAENEKTSLASIKESVKREFNEKYGIISNEDNMLFQSLGTAIAFLNEDMSKKKNGNVEFIQRLSSLREMLDEIYEKMPWMRKEALIHKIKNN